MHLARLPIRIRDGEVVPGFLGEADLPWLRALLELAAAHAGAPWRELQAAMSRPLGERAPVGRQALASAVLGRSFRRRIVAPVSPPRARQVVFRVAAGGGTRADTIMVAAGELGLTPAQAEQALFADLPPERAVVPPDPMPTAAELAVQANLEMCRSLLMRAVEVEIQLAGQARVLARRAQRRGLICTVVAGVPDGLCLKLSGPLSLFRRTTRYGHALGTLLPALAECDRFEVNATVVVSQREVELRLRTGDPFLPAVGAVRRTRSVEAQLGRDLRDQDDWTVVREPEPIRAGSALVFPDFELVSREDSSCRWLIEIVGFWTPEHLDDRRAKYREAGIDRLILCVDDRMKCAGGQGMADGHLIRFRRSVSAQEIWRLIRGSPGDGAREERS